MILRTWDGILNGKETIFELSKEGGSYTINMTEKDPKGELFQFKTLISKDYQETINTCLFLMDITGFERRRSK